jgi:hypothetical protein
LLVVETLQFLLLVVVAAELGTMALVVEVEVDHLVLVAIRPPTQQLPVHPVVVLLDTDKVDRGRRLVMLITENLGITAQVVAGHQVPQLAQTVLVVILFTVVQVVVQPQKIMLPARVLVVRLYLVVMAVLVPLMQITQRLVLPPAEVAEVQKQVTLVPVVLDAFNLHIGKE